MVKKFRESRHTDKQTISFLNWKIYSDRPVFTPEKQIRSFFASSEATWRLPMEANCERLQLMWWFADLACDDVRSHMFRWHNLEQEFLSYELTGFLCLSSRVFLRSCSFDLQYWKSVFSFQWPQTANLKIHAWETWQPFWIEIGPSRRIKPTEISSTCRSELDPTSCKFQKFSDLRTYSQDDIIVATPSQKAVATKTP